MSAQGSYQPKQAAAFEGFSYLVEPREGGELFQEGQKNKTKQNPTRMHVGKKHIS